MGEATVGTSHHPRCYYFVIKGIIVLWIILFFVKRWFSVLIGSLDR